MHTQANTPPVKVPVGYKGEAYLQSGRKVFWTGKVAIGLTAQTKVQSPPTRDELIFQAVLK